jgi:prolipoprotein diacylglyceryltransferase
MGNEIGASIDLAGLDLALGLAFIRLGCFLGGCCYGRPARWGVLYRSEQLTVVRGWRTFSCGPVPSGRVVPIQLFEAAFSASAFAVLVAWRTHVPSAQGRVLLAFMVAYGIWRFVSDFWRGTSVRPRWAGLSEAQWVSTAVAAVSAFGLVVT